MVFESAFANCKSIIINIIYNHSSYNLA